MIWIIYIGPNYIVPYISVISIHLLDAAVIFVIFPSLSSNFPTFGTKLVMIKNKVLPSWVPKKIFPNIVSKIGKIAKLSSYPTENRGAITNLKD